MIGLVDADLLGRQTNFPNLALMKISSYHKSLGTETKLITTLEETFDCERLICSKVFTDTQEPNWLAVVDKPIERGGTGYNLFGAPPLPEYVEHIMPDYELYRSYAENAPSGRNGLSGTARTAYLKASLGFTTRGCFRRCAFCVNKNKTHVERWSPVSEFYDPSRTYIFLLDDNILGYPKWQEVFEELIATGKRVSYRQGMDVRIMTNDKAKTLERIKYWGDVIFAFDNYADKEIFERGSDIYREYCSKETQIYLLVGFYKRGLDEVRDLVERVKICKRYNFFPFIMRHADGKNDVYHDVFVQAARFYNQRSFSRNGDLLYFIRNYGSERAKKILEQDAALRKELERLVA